MDQQLIFVLYLQLVAFGLVSSGNVCGRPPLAKNAVLSEERRIYEPGEEVTFLCAKGYRMSGGSRKITCSISGKWSTPTIRCSPKLCSYPGPLENGHIIFSSLEFGSNLTFQCMEGYFLHGQNTSHCKDDGTWDVGLPHCEPIFCPMPDIPHFGKIKHIRPMEGNKTRFGEQVQYECQPPFVLFGNETAFCQADGNWTEMPQCKKVSCSPPTSIPNGFMSFAVIREYGYQENIKYGCKPDFVLDGPSEVQCMKTGKWSLKPVCRAHCTVSISRGRVFYNGKKYWIENLPDKKVQHSESVAFYCKDEKNKCGYPVLSQCVDGHLEIPSCFIEPGKAEYVFQSSKLPSEIKQC
ncbi:beta-2-glycoprotein 1-like [Polypterus senegalus]|uniref:beta-2-glycoprotein 1-like n=1 Tax=Polypterus senegalus TaxID=55291 RepID=UPI001963A048|nr:beta-2-glycoprotein 1-like [Polypterus senegalus]